MTRDAGAPFSARFSPQLTRWLAFGWVAAITFVWLFRYEAWVLPVQFCQLVPANVPALHVGPYFGEFWSARLTDAGLIAGILVVAFGVGAIAVGRFTAERSLLTGLLALAVGLWIVAGTVLMLGVVSVRLTGFVFVLLLGWFHPAARSFLRWPRTDSLDGWSKFFLALIVAATLLNLLGAMAPPFEYDELEYHLGAPTEYIKAGKIIALPHNFYSNMPQLTEMLYLLAMVLRSDMAAKMVHWSFGVLSALAIHAVAARLWSKRVGVAAAALFYCLPYVQDLSQTARIDLATTFFAILAFGALLLDWRSLSALATGCAIATKWPAVAVVLLPVLVWIIIQTKSLRPAATFCLIACLVTVPWLVKNFIFTGNPVYPMLFGGAHWSEAQAALFTAKHGPQFHDGAFLQVLEKLWQCSVADPMAVPVLLMTAPLLLLFRKVGTPTRRVVVLFTGAYLSWYLLTFRPWRFLLPAMPLAALMGALALEHVEKWGRVFVAAAMIGSLTLIAANDLVDVGNPRRVPARVSFLTHALGQESREEFVAWLGNEMFEPIVWMNHNLPPAAKVLYIGEARTHYARHSVVWATAYDQHPVLQLSLDHLRAAGVTHVYVNFSEWKRLTENYDYLLNLDHPALRRLLQDDSRTRLIHENGRRKVWELLP